MANIKFSAFTQKVVLGDVDFLVGYTGADNVRVAPSVFSGIYLPLAGGIMTGTLNFSDNVKAIWGNGSDLQIYHDTSNSYIADQGTGRLIIKTDYFEIDNAAGTEAIIEGIENGAVNLYYDSAKKFETTATGASMEGTYPKIEFIDDTGVARNFSVGTNNETFTVRNETGGSDAFTIYNDNTVAIGTNTVAAPHAAADDFVIKGPGTTAVGMTIANSSDSGTGTIFFGDSSSSTVGGIRYDHGTDNMAISALDDINFTCDAATFSGDVTAGEDHNGTSFIKATNTNAGVSATARLQAEGETSQIDMIATSAGYTGVAGWADSGVISTDSGASGGLILNSVAGIVKLQTQQITALTLDSSQDATFAGDVHVADTKKFLCGLSNDLQLWHAGGAGSSYLENYTGNLYINNYANDSDIVFASDDGAGGTATYFYLDGSAVNGTSVKGATKFPDASKIYMGTGGDLEIFHNGSQAYIENYTGTFNFTQHVNDADILFKCDDGAGGVTTYLTLDGGAVKTIASKNFAFLDDVYAEFGDSGDLQIYHNASHSWISDQGTGNLNILTSSLNINNAADTQNMIVATDGGAVSLYTNGVLKLQTSSTGTTTTGQMNIAALNTAPASAGAAGTLGEIRYTADYIYVCTATNTWKRTAIATW